MKPSTWTWTWTWLWRHVFRLSHCERKIFIETAVEADKAATQREQETIEKAKRNAAGLDEFR